MCSCTEKPIPSKEQVLIDALNFFHDDTNWSKIGQEIQSHPWKREFKNLSSEQMLHHFYDVLLVEEEETTSQK